MPSSAIIKCALQDNASFKQHIPNWRVFCKALRKKKFTDRLLATVKENHELFFHLFNNRDDFRKMLDTYPRYNSRFFSLLVNNDTIFEKTFDEYCDFNYFARYFPDQLEPISNKILQDEKQWQRAMITKDMFFCIYKDFPQLRPALFKRVCTSVVSFSAIIPLVGNLSGYLHHFPEHRTQFLDTIFSSKEFYLDYFYPGDLRYTSSWELYLATLQREEYRNDYWRAEIVHRLPVVLDWAFKQSKERRDIEVLAYLYSVMQEYTCIVEQVLVDTDLARFCSSHINRAIYKAQLEERNELLKRLNEIDKMLLNLNTLTLVGFCSRAYQRYGCFKSPAPNNSITPVIQSKLDCSDVAAFTGMGSGVSII
jgi:hypothetical protein